jgi:hypothetical protein
MMSTACERGCSLALKDRMRRLSTDSSPLSFMSSCSSLLEEKEAVTDDMEIQDLT